MITRCPACQTHFRVHAEQLAARAGQVRCGKCGKVFDALEHLSEELGSARAAQLALEHTSESTSFEPAGEPPSAPAAASTEQDAATPVEPRAIFIAPPENLTRPEEADAALPAGESGTDVIPGVIALEAGSQERSAWHAAAETAPPRLAGSAAELAAPLAQAPGYDFGPEAQKEKSRRRWPWLLGAILLVAMLFAQIAYRYRSGITVLVPAIKPYAAALCAQLGCEVPLPRRIELMSIEASDLQADTNNPNIMVLSATLKNRAVFSQQLPLLELTLTDAQDQPLVRRVLSPQDYLGKRINAMDGFAANSEIPVRAFIEATQVKAVGYRLYLFYP